MQYFCCVFIEWLSLCLRLLSKSSRQNTSGQVTHYVSCEWDDCTAFLVNSWYIIQNISLHCNFPFLYSYYIPPPTTTTTRLKWTVIPRCANVMLSGFMTQLEELLFLLRSKISCSKRRRRLNTWTCCVFKCTKESDLLSCASCLRQHLKDNQVTTAVMSHGN